jgi:hypothetical protein
MAGVEDVADFRARVYPAALFVLTFHVVVAIALFTDMLMVLLIVASSGEVIEIPALTFKVTTTSSDAEAALAKAGSNTGKSAASIKLTTTANEVA